MARLSALRRRRVWGLAAYMVRRLPRSVALCVGLVAAPVLALSQPAWADDSQVMRWGDSRLVLYTSLDNSVRFMLDRTGDDPLIQFDGSPEIIPLRARPGARGDTILETTDGERVLRLARYGSATYYPPIDERPGFPPGDWAIGIPVSPAAEGMPLARSVSTPEEAQETLNGLADRVEGFLEGQRVPFDADWDTQRVQRMGSPGLLLAAENTALAIERMSENPVMREMLRRDLRRIRLDPSDRIGLWQSPEDGTLYVTYVERLGPRGVASSDAIQSYLRETLRGDL